MGYYSQSVVKTGEVTWAASACELAKQCDVVLTGLPRPEHVSKAMGISAGTITGTSSGEDSSISSEQVSSSVDPNGILAGLNPGCIWIEHSTTDLTNTRRIRKLVEAKGGKAVAAPLTGGMQLLRAGKMVSLIGCDCAVTLEKITPLLQLSAPRMVPCGKFGHETVVKILTNMLCAVQDCAMGEAML